MTDAPSAFPLAWPARKPRTPWHERQRGSFQASGKLITRTAAVKKLGLEVQRLGGQYLLISSDMPLRKDGLPNLGVAAPADPGVCAYFQMSGKPYAMACDTFGDIAQNIAAIANHIEATRRIERYGVATAAETLQAFQALSAPKKPHEILGVSATAPEPEVRAAWRKLIAAHHPDQGGSESRAAELNAARDAMLKGYSA